jgi:hypothetical protein
MSLLQATHEAVSRAFRHRRLWLIQFIANPILFGLFAGWLLIPAAHTWQLALNALLAIVIVVAVVVVHAGTMNYFSDTNRIENPELAGAFLRAMSHIVAIGVCAAVFYVLWNLLDKADPYQFQLPPYIRSIFPVSLRRHFSLESLEAIFQWTIFAVRWIVIPGVVLPFLVRTADLGFRGFSGSGFSEWRKAIASVSYWLVLAGAVLAGVLATQKIMNWTPDFRTSSLRHESISFAVRLPLAYLLGLFAWMLTCSLLGRLGSGQRDVG